MDLSNIPFTRAHPDDIPRPWLPVLIKNPHTGKSQKVLGLIDTGADECALPAGYAKLLGHDLEKGSTKNINTGGGLAVAYTHTMSFEINGVHVDNVKIDFLPHLQIVLIGVKSFLSKFVLIIDFKNAKFSLTPHS